MSSSLQQHDESADGRHLRRQRNIDAVRATILDMLERRETLTLAVVAERSGVTIRSIYRYFDDLEDAVDSARQHRIDVLRSEWETSRGADLDAPFEDRVETILQRRLWLERLGRPLRADQLLVDFTLQLDHEAIDAFMPELERLSVDERDDAARTIASLLRPRSIRALMEPDDDARRAKDAVRFTLGKVLDVTSDDRVERPALQLSS